MERQLAPEAKRLEQLIRRVAENALKLETSSGKETNPAFLELMPLIVSVRSELENALQHLEKKGVTGLGPAVKKMEQLSTALGALFDG